MRSNLKLTNLESTPSISDYLEKKLSALDKLIDLENENVYADVEIGKTSNHHFKGDIFRAEINLHLEDETLRAVAETDNLYASIDDMKDEILKEVRNKKKYRKQILKKGHQKIKKILRGFFSKDNNN
ncbi:MAG: ribosome-associated translation inhibitor RaiA [Candidatus Paceibacterota bacterium]